MHSQQHKQLISKLRQSGLSADIIELCNTILDMRCDARNGSESVLERTYLARVIKSDIIELLKPSEEKERKAPMTAE